ncbi:alkaline phosphatase family protein [Actinoplanes sp. NPDC051475]|uniref:alkaline phosphatase family protein n=1 Tax=Actinoplanes sp. NPDC051475 TaxID=3157225 RepID=UPI00344E47B5
MNKPQRLLATVLAASLAMAGCQGGDRRTLSLPSTAPPAAGYTKVLVIAEENHEYDRIIGSPDAPYLNELARTYGTASHFDAGYPAQCPSLAAYILMTSGSTAGICDDRAPKAHPLRGDNLFHQVAASGREWRDYAESAPRPCALDNGADGRYLVRHVPATYYLDDRSDCARWSVPMGDPQAGAMHDDISAGRLPSFAFVSPDACHDMHGADPCPTDRVGNGDRWLMTWLPSILSGPDYRAGRLIVLVTWDEGTSTDNHIPSLVISPTTKNVVAADAFTHCSTLRTTEEVLGLPLLGCAQQAPSMTTAFHL